MLSPNISGSRHVGKGFILSFFSVLGNNNVVSLISVIKLEVDDSLGLSTGLLGGLDVC